MAAPAPNTAATTMSRRYPRTRDNIVTELTEPRDLNSRLESDINYVALTTEGSFTKPVRPSRSKNPVGKADGDSRWRKAHIITGQALNSPIVHLDIAAREQMFTGEIEGTHGDPEIISGLN